MLADNLRQLAAEAVRGATRRKMKIVTAESCTGGLIAAALTEISGVSAVFDRGFVTYSNAAKTESLGVEPALIETYGAVSEEVAQAMVVGALAQSGADVAVAVTGIAGPGGGTKEKPVGLVYIAAASKENATVERHQFSGSRGDIRAAAAERALELLTLLCAS